MYRKKLPDYQFPPPPTSQRSVFHVRGNVCARACRLALVSSLSNLAHSSEILVLPRFLIG